MLERTRYSIKDAKFCIRTYDLASDFLTKRLRGEEIDENAHGEYAVIWDEKKDCAIFDHPTKTDQLLKQIEAPVLCSEYATVASHVNTREINVKGVWYGKGWPGVFVVDGKKGPDLTLFYGERVRFNVDVPFFHPFYFTSSEKGASDRKETTYGPEGVKHGVVNGSFEFLVDRSFPKLFYYQCRNHQYMGGIIHVKESRVGANLPDVQFNLSKITEFAVRANPPISGVLTGGYADPKNPYTLYLLEQAGRILRYDVKTQKVDLSAPVLDLSDRIALLMKRDDPFVRFADERGVIGMAFHPEYAKSGSKWENAFFVRYSAPGESKTINHVTVISMFRMDDDPQKVRNSEQLLIFSEQPEMNHNGGAMEFGPDGMFYVGYGDGGGANDQHGEILEPDDPERRAYLGNASVLPSDRENLHGTLLRIDLDAFNDRFFNEEIKDWAKEMSNRTRWLIDNSLYLYGLRNPFKFSFDSKGRLFVADVGQDRFEQVHILAPPHTAAPPKHMGWNAYEGNEVFSATVADYLKKNDIATHKPAIVYSREQDPKAAIIGGYVDESRDSPLSGAYIFGDYSGRIFIATERNGRWSHNEVAHLNENIHSFAKDGNGEIYVLALDARSKTNIIYKILRSESHLKIQTALPFGFPDIEKRSVPLIRKQNPYGQFLTESEIANIIYRAQDETLEVTSKLRRDKNGSKSLVKMQIAVIAISEPSGGAVYILSAPDAWSGSADIAKNKAYTAFAFSSDENALSSRSIGELSQPKGLLRGIGNTNRGEFGIVTFPGGLPLYKGGELVGAIGVSGDGVDEDEKVAFVASEDYKPPEYIRIDKVTENKVLYVRKELLK